MSSTPSPMPLPETERSDILVVDDTPENITVLREILVRAGHRVRPALNGTLALRAIEAQCPDLVLLDIMMPGLNGYETCARIKTIPAAHDLPILFISALDGTEDKLRAFREGGVDYVSKPFHASEVLARVQAHLRLRAARRQLARQNQELEAAARLRDDVDAILRHDLKSPLATILTAAESLADLDPMPSAPAATLTGHIREAGWAMLEQIHRSLDLLKMERGVYALVPEPLDLYSILRRIAAELALTPAGRRAPVEIASPTPAAPWWIEGEAMLCHGLFRNLIKNALEASPPGVPVRIVSSVDAAAGDPAAADRTVPKALNASMASNASPPAATRSFTLINHGEVPAAIRTRLFQKFATAGKAGGTGLGAYSARLMAETQRGTIRLAPATPGQTAITVTLPRARTATPPPPLRSPGLSGGLPGGAVAPDRSVLELRSPVVGRVLVVDDDAAHADAVARLLASVGIETVLASDGDGAITLLARGDFSAALVDFEMPGTNGPEVARRHREAGGRTRLLALTAHDGPAIHAACRAAGFDRVLAKPVGKARLLAELSGAVADVGGPAEHAQGVAADSQSGSSPSPSLSPSSAPPAPEAIDPDLAALVPTFLEARAQELLGLETALAAGDSDRVRALSHRLRGGFSIYGFTAASAACARLEQAAAAGDVASAAIHLATLTRTLEALRLAQGVAASPVPPSSFHANSSS